MTARCPKCTQETLAPVAQADPPPLSCPRCHGLWIHPGAARALAVTGALDAVDSADTSRREEDVRTGICPEGHGIMTRAKVAWDDPCYLERCSRCGGVWLDAGEWHRLAAMNLLDNLEQLWSPAWRRRLSEAESDAHLHRDIAATFGAELAGRIEELAGALAGHESAPMALAYLERRVLAGRHK